MKNGMKQRMATRINNRQLSILVFSLLFAWVLAFPFEGQILYALMDSYQLEPHRIVFRGIAATFVGLFSCGFFIKKRKAAKKLLLGSMIFCIMGSGVFLFPPSLLWTIALISTSFLGGACVAAWGFYLWSETPKKERIKTVADGLIYSNILMIFLNMAATHISPRFGMGLAILTLGAAVLFARWLPESADTTADASWEQQKNQLSITKPLAFLYVFIVVIAINSGLMYQVLNPAYAHLTWLVSWYWAIPYIVAIFIMRNLPGNINRTYILYVAIAMIGFSFIAFAALDRSAPSFLIVNTLIMGACGVYDLFWWSILGEMLDLHRNPAKVFGMGLSANVLGVLMGGLIGNAIAFSKMQNVNSTLLALSVVCVTLILLPPLHRHLSLCLKDHAYLSTFCELPKQKQEEQIKKVIRLGNLSERESQVASLLLQGKTYKNIGDQLTISENTVKYHVKNIYAKLNIQSRSQLISILWKEEKEFPPA